MKIIRIFSVSGKFSTLKDKNALWMVTKQKTCVFANEVCDKEYLESEATDRQILRLHDSVTVKPKAEL